MRDEFSGEAAEFEVVDSVMHCKWPGTRGDLCIPIGVFRENMARANRALDKWAERERGAVLPFGGKRRGGH